MTLPLVETLLSPLIQSFLTVTELSTVLPISVEIWGGGGTVRGTKGLGLGCTRGVRGFCKGLCKGREGGGGEGCIERRGTDNGTGKFCRGGGVD